MAQQQKKQNRSKQPQDPYAQRHKQLVSAVQRLRGWVGSDPSRTPELADALTALTEHRLLGHAYSVAAPEAQEAVKLAAQLLTADGPIGPYTSVTDAARYLTAVVHLAVIQSAAGLSEAAAETVGSLVELREQLDSLPLVEALAPTTVVWALSVPARGALTTGNVAAANAYVDAALQRMAESGLRREPAAAYVVVDTDRLTSDARWAAGLAEDALTHLHLARETYDAVVDGRLAQPARLSPGLLQRLSEPLFGLYRDLADRLFAVGEVDLGLVTRRQLVELLRGLAAKDETARVQLAAALADLVRDLRTQSRAEEAELVDEELAAVSAADRAAAGELDVAPPRGADRVHWQPLDRFAAFAGAITASVDLAALEAELQREAAVRLAEERSEAQRVERQRQEEARLSAERREAARVDKERRAAERAAAEAAEAARRELERIEVERIEAKRLAAQEEAERQERKRRREERMEAHRREQERLDAERLEVERLAWAQREGERLAADPAERERLELERLQAEIEELERLEAEGAARAAAELAAAELAAAEAEVVAAEAAEAEVVAEVEVAAEIEAERRRLAEGAAVQAEAERLAVERVERERAEAERIEQERAEAERERIEAERERVQAERERVEAERGEQERAEAERAERERIEAERAEAERAEAERRAAAAELQRIEAERIESERIEARRRERERAEKERLAAQAGPAAQSEHEDTASVAPEPVEDELETIYHAWQEARTRGDRRSARAHNERVVELLRPRAEQDLAEYGPRLLHALEELSSARLRSGELFASRAPAREAKALAKALGRR